MFEIKGKRNSAICFAKNPEEKSVEQIRRMCDYELTDGSRIRIMPDVHSGKGCTIGTTMTISDKAVPNIVGVDIGCGMYTVELGKDELDFSVLDEAAHYIPSGHGVWKKKQVDFPMKELRCYKMLKRVQWLENSIGTLGGGNHFIEVDKGSDGTLYLVIHTGSRNLGKQVAELYQVMAQDIHSIKGPYMQQREKLIESYKASGRMSEIQSALKTMAEERKNTAVPEDLCYLYGSYLQDYLHDVDLCQKYAVLNREIIASILLGRIGRAAGHSFHTVHNYIDTDEMILRKGAIAAHKGEKVLIPINMRDGSILAVGKGNPEWNYSAPHGAGRIMSRTQAKKQLSMAEYQKAMEGIYTTSVTPETIDEAPMAYKPMEEILDVLGETADVIDILKPVYNFKASESFFKG